MEVWTSKNPSLQCFYVFGCEAYAHVLKENQSKLDKKVIKCILVNYGIGVKGYKILYPTVGKFLYNVHSIFREFKPFPIVV
jgi:hypothetical protein